MAIVTIIMIIFWNVFAAAIWSIIIVDYLEDKKKKK
jgi:hypothetical protein